MILYRSIHKYIRTSSHVNTNNQIDHILIDGWRFSSVLDANSFKAADCDNDLFGNGKKLGRV
jgi:hypothetical protein